jgi:hypothetical protein
MTSQHDEDDFVQTFKDKRQQGRGFEALAALTETATPEHWFNCPEAQAKEICTLLLGAGVRLTLAEPPAAGPQSFYALLMEVIACDDFNKHWKQVDEDGTATVHPVQAFDGSVPSNGLVPSYRGTSHAGSDLMMIPPPSPSPSPVASGQQEKDAERAISERAQRQADKEEKKSRDAAKRQKAADAADASRRARAQERERVAATKASTTRTRRARSASPANDRERPASPAPLRGNPPAAPATPSTSVDLARILQLLERQAARDNGAPPGLPNQASNKANRTPGGGQDSISQCYTPHGTAGNANENFRDGFNRTMMGLGGAGNFAAQPQRTPADQQASERNRRMDQRLDERDGDFDPRRVRGHKKKKKKRASRESSPSLRGTDDEVPEPLDMGYGSTPSSSSSSHPNDLTPLRQRPASQRQLGINAKTKEGGKWYRALLKQHTSVRRWAQEHHWKNNSARRQVMVLARFMDISTDQYGIEAVDKMDAAEIVARRIMALTVFDKDGTWEYAKNLEEQDNGTFIPQNLLDDALKRHKHLDKVGRVAKEGRRGTKKAADKKKVKKEARAKGAAPPAEEARPQADKASRSRRHRRQSYSSTDSSGSSSQSE